jgi:hypothetical protein
MLIEMLRLLLRKVLPDLPARDKYRPERHYMRGPGPKSRERESPGPADSAKA